jgi:hypothetical protein
MISNFLLKVYAALSFLIIILSIFLLNFYFYSIRNFVKKLQDSEKLIFNYNPIIYQQQKYKFFINLKKIDFFQIFNKLNQIINIKIFV